MAAVAYPRPGGRGRPAPLRPVRAPSSSLRPRPAAAGAGARPGGLPSSVYWRRRALLLVALVLACLWLARAGAVVFGGGPLTAPGGAPVPVSGQIYVVRPGDTVWSIAHRYDPRGDERPLVAAITDELGGADLQPGQVLRIP